MTYYKALRPDGTDFATGMTRPVLGEWMPKIEGELIVCQRGYHVADTAAETLVGGSWPCKLYQVEAKWFARSQSFTGDHAHKGVCRTYRLVEELPSWQAFGPNGEAVVALVEQARTLTPEDATRLAAAGYAAWGGVGAAARNAAWSAAWYTAGSAARAAAGSAAGSAAWYAVGYAANALVVRDLITTEQFDILYGPWKAVMETPR